MKRAKKTGLYCPVCGVEVYLYEIKQHIKSKAINEMIFGPENDKKHLAFYLENTVIETSRVWKRTANSIVSKIKN